jgi:plastocyanin
VRETNIGLQTGDGKRTAFSRLARAFCLLPFAFSSVILPYCLPEARGAEAATVRARIVLVNPAVPRKPIGSSNAVVWLTPVTSSGNQSVGIAAARPHRRFRVVQRHKRFDPHVLVVPIGSVVEFPNLDPFFHNVFSLFEGKRFDLGLYEAGTTHSVTFDRPGICYIFCNIHPQMSAVVLVVRTTYYGVSDPSGDIAIPGVPPGEYELEVWQERTLPEVLTSLARKITVSSGDESFGTIRLIESGDLTPRHKDKYGRDYEPPNPPSPIYQQP